MTDNNAKNEDADKASISKGLFKYSDKGQQTVFRMFGIELTAPSSLKSPGVVYMSFVIINLILFLILKSFVVN